MKMLATMMVACSVPAVGVALAQQPELSEAAQQQAPGQEAAESIPATQHQEEALGIPSELFQQLDTNADGVISRQEALAEPSLAENWGMFDEDGNDELDHQEFVAFEHASAGPAAQDDVEVARGETTEEERIPATQHQQDVLGGDLIDQLDEDGDGRISRDEARSDDRLTDEWERLDEDGDGNLDSSELSQLEQ